MPGGVGFLGALVGNVGIPGPLRLDRRPRKVSPPARLEAVLRNRLGVGRIEHGGLVEVVGEGLPGDLVCSPTVGPHGEFYLGRSLGGLDHRGGGGLTSVGKDLCDGLGLGA